MNLERQRSFTVSPSDPRVSPPRYANNPPPHKQPPSPGAVSLSPGAVWSPATPPPFASSHDSIGDIVPAARAPSQASPVAQQREALPRVWSPAVPPPSSEEFTETPYGMRGAGRGAAAAVEERFGFRKSFFVREEQNELEKATSQTIHPEPWVRRSGRDVSLQQLPSFGMVTG